MSGRRLIDRLRARGDEPALVWRDSPVSYAALVNLFDTWRRTLAEAAVGAGTAVALEGDYSPGACAALLALIDAGAIAVPLTPEAGSSRETFLDIARVRCAIAFDAADRGELAWRAPSPPHELYDILAERQAPGLVLFSSGSTGQSKAALHDFDRLLEKFETPRRAYCTLTFLLLDHIGGINTLLYTLANGGTVVTVATRDPDAVCAAIARHRVQLLPTSPTFLNLLLLSEAWRRHDLSSLELVTYGTEVMPQATLTRLRDALPHVRLQQTYGLSEVGILRSKSREDGSLWVKVGGEGYETAVIDGLLHVRARSAMLGYLNAPSPFDADGWMNTQDEVEVDGEYLRILGRRSEVINVGGQKVYPAEIESVLLQAPNVADATVSAERNPILGQIVSATVRLKEPEPPETLARRIREFCAARLPAYKVPLRVVASDDRQLSARFKKIRR